MYFFGYVIVIQLLMATVDLTSKKALQTSRPVTAKAFGAGRTVI